MSKDRPFVVAAIPAYNEEKTIARVILQAQRFVDSVVVCDDGSTDMTAEIAEALGALVIRHEENKGKGKALKTIFAEAEKLNADVVVTVDSDGQHDANEIPRLLDPILCGKSDIVVGSRFVKGAKTDVPFYRRMGLGVINQLNKMVNGIDVRDTQSGFRAYSFKALKTMTMCESTGYGVESEQLALATKSGLSIVEVPVTVKYNGLDKTSKKSPLVHGPLLVSTILRMIIEEKPLLFLGVPGSVSLFIGVLFGVWMFQIYAVERYIETNVALASIAFILIGLFALFTAITLYAIARLMHKQVNNN